MDATATARSARPAVRLLNALEQMPDPRHHNIHHKLMDILTIALFAVIGGIALVLAAIGVVTLIRVPYAWAHSLRELVVRTGSRAASTARRNSTGAPARSHSRRPPPASPRPGSTLRVRG